MDLAFGPLAKGVKLATVATGYRAEVVSSEVKPSRCFKGRMVRKSVIRWTESNYPAGVREGETDIWVQVEGRFPKFIVTADN